MFIAPPYGRAGTEQGDEHAQDASQPHRGRDRLTAQPATAALPIPTLPSSGSFANRIDNPWFPLHPGTVFDYRGVKDGKRARDVLTVTHVDRTILGIRATVIHDRLYLNGHLAERTTDWYAQDRSGNVWYLGESTATLDARGRTLSTEGSWRAGVGGARAGIYMPAHPTSGDTGRQEYSKGHAEDQFKVLEPDRPRDAAPRSHRTTRCSPRKRRDSSRATSTTSSTCAASERSSSSAVKGGSERLVLFSVSR